ncbi:MULTISPECIES: site-2 protease family protein [unclassified Sphingomonas]|jgi:Zn-dependent protease|uniref:site-2 protease family protein n=1 Tax=unclassified Sphingomonas TaxID=196159 RepID=UPI0016176620|nr:MULTISPECIES: site-2 protease family protein [unclassified Sphingomonas]MBB3347115.1 Zn-dependent protease [Sphingomonas sp. BK069]MBB3471955.1 Zn-dependent protease [Sphingomonas sp. BK345]
MDPTGIIWRAAVWIIPLVLAIVFHEVSHGLAARALGDPTAAEQRRLSLNPLRHVDPVGTVILPLLLALAKAPVFGWAKPVPVDARRLPHPRRDMMLVALAGPGSNLVLALVGAVLLGALTPSLYGIQPGSLTAFVAANLLNFVMINVFLAIFNLIPLPPFDGGHVVAGLLPERLAQRWDQLARYGLLLFILLLLVLPSIVPGANIVQRLVAPPAQALTEWYLGLAQSIAG